MLVSFIIPAYNAADTIVRCLESIYGLSLKQDEFEVIVIDDASSDNTVEVIEHYCQKGKSEELRGKCENLILLKQATNNRQGAARNRGVKVAKGEYICFVDADDVVTGGVVAAIMLAKETQTDMTAYHCANVNEHGRIICEKEHLGFEDDEVFSGMALQNRHPFWFSGPVAYVYSRTFLERVNYPFAEGVLYEDSDFVIVHLYFAHRMTYSGELGYKAYYRDGSTTHHTSFKNVADYLLLGVRMLRFYERIRSEGVNELSNDHDKFAEGILEGACWNVAKSCKRLMRLQGSEDVRAFYDRIDSNINRMELSVDKNIQKYYWTAWMSICLKHKHVAIALLAVLIPIFKLTRR